MKQTKKDRVFEILEYELKYGEKETCELFNIKHDTIRRYKDLYKNEIKEAFEDKQLYKKVLDTFSKEEIKRLVNSKKTSIEESKTIIRDFSGDIVTFAHITDTHIGSDNFSSIDYISALKEFENQNVQFICHTGDVTEGLSHRPGHVYECTHYGADAQQSYAIDLFKMTDIPFYMIDGNHDRWFIKASGTKIVKNICDHLDHCVFLGHDEGDIIINGIKIRLFHGEDFSSYATSYRIQKLIEAIPGGEKPHVLLVGHTHKQGYFFERNIHCITGGALSYQSKWMRSKRMACHTGFYIIKMCIKDCEVKWIEPRWYPFYKRIDKPVEVKNV